jgi:nucleoside-diphosphate-sugar epimerase
MQGFVTGGGRGFIGGHVVQALERTEDPRFAGNGSTFAMAWRS